MANLQDKRRIDGDLSPDCRDRMDVNCICDRGYHDTMPIDGSPAQIIGLATALADFLADSDNADIDELAQSIIYRLCAKQGTDELAYIAASVGNGAEGLHVLADALRRNFKELRQGKDLDDPYTHGPDTF